MESIKNTVEQKNKIYIPIITNTPLISAQSHNVYGSLSLLKNTKLLCYKNKDYDKNIVKYGTDYQNNQAISGVFLQHMQITAQKILKYVSEGEKIVEIGCGKGDFINLLEKNGRLQVYGFDTVYDGTHPNIEKRYLHAEDRISADFLVMRHVLEYIVDPYEFIKMLQSIFNNCLIYIEIPNFDWIINHQSFFDVTYERINYFTPMTLKALFSDRFIEAGLSFDGQYQYIIANIKDLCLQFSKYFLDLSYWQAVDFYDLFPTILERIRIIEQKLNNDRKAYIWGASNKGCMFLVHCNKFSDIVNKTVCAIDINPAKIGKFLPGSMVQIRGKSFFFDTAKSGDLLIISNKNYENEIMSEVRQSHLKDIEYVTL